MGRELKFRYWALPLKDGETGVMVYSQDCASLEAFFAFASSQYHVLMQFTGLLDKSGTNIYEGDVLAKRGLDFESEEVIEWSLSSYNGPEPLHVEIKRDVCTLDVFRYWLKNEDFGYEGEDLEDPSEWEVIGNIHEHPELLPEAKWEGPH